MKVELKIELKGKVLNCQFHFHSLRSTFYSCVIFIFNYNFSSFFHFPFPIFIFLLNSDKKQHSNRVIFIFHCKFSSFLHFPFAIFIFHRNFSSFFHFPFSFSFFYKIQRKYNTKILHKTITLLVKYVSSRHLY